MDTALITEKNDGIEEKKPVFDDTEVTDDEFVELPSGQPLTFQEALEIAAHEPSRFVAVMGATGSGKTTLVASLYQMFLCECEAGGFLFAGSKTLTAFETRVFYTRTTSYRPHPDTMRTRNGALDVLHLKLYDNKRSRHIHLLLSDFSGEDYNQARGNPQTANELLPQIKDAHIIVFLVDGAKLAKVRERQSEIQRSIHLLKAFYDGGLIDENTSIIIAISKYDCIGTLDNETRELIDRMLRQSFKGQLSALFDRMTFLNTAAMPSKTNDIKPFFGLKELLELLFKKRQQPEYNVPAIRTDSQFNLWGERAKNE